MLNLNKYSVGFIVIALAFALSACRLSPKPVLTSLEQNSWYKSEYKKIGFMRLSYDTEELTLAYDFLRLVEVNLTNYFSSMGYEVEPLSTYETIYNEELAKRGGFYDPVSGELDEAKQDKFNQSLMEQYLGQSKTDLLLSLHFFRTSGKFENSEIVWDNMKDTTTYPPGVLISGRKGFMPAISVMIRIFDPATGETKQRVQGVQVNLGFHPEFDIHPEDMPLHYKNLRLGLQQLKP